MTTKQEQLHQLNNTIRERKAYLEQIEEQIATVTAAGENRIRELTFEADAEENRKAKLLKECLALEERKRLAEIA